MSFSSFAANQSLLYNPPPVFYLVESNLVYFAPEVLLNLSFMAIDPKIFHLRYSMQYGPPNSTLDTSTSLFLWHPEFRSENSVNVSVSDGYNDVSLCI